MDPKYLAVTEKQERLRQEIERRCVEASDRIAYRNAIVRAAKYVADMAGEKRNTADEKLVLLQAAADIIRMEPR